MSYTALYRKFRPAEFGDVKGQERYGKNNGCENICESGKL